MPESADFPGAITTQLFRGVARLSTTLSADITNTATTIGVASLTSFPSSGFVTIENETIYYASKSTETGAGDLQTCTRGYAGTNVAHLAAVAVKYSIVAATINRIQVEIEEMQQCIGATGTTYAGSLANIIIAQSTKLGGSTEGQINAGYLGGSTNLEFVGITKAEVIAGQKTFDEGAIIHAPKTYTPAGAATATLDLALGNNHEIQMPAGNITIAISNETDGQYFTTDITQDGTGSRTVTWFTTIKWSGGSEPTLTTTANKRDSFGFKVTGTDTYDGFVIGQNI